jgi:hypothetical protein
MIRQHYLGKYSTKDELININTQEDMDVISKACSRIIDIMDEAIQDANAEVLSFGIYWCEKIKNIGCPTGRLNFLNEHKACLGALQPTMNVATMVKYIEKMRSKYGLLIKLQDILLKTDGFNLLKTEDFKDKICTYLGYISTSISLQLSLIDPDSFIGNDKSDLLMLAELYTMIDKIEDIPDYIIKSISYENIVTSFISKGLLNSKYQSFNLRYAKLIAKIIMKNEYNLEEFSESLHLYAYRYLPESISKISEDSFLGFLCNPNITQEARNTLQQAFIDSGILNPDKKINSSTGITLRDYTKEHYNMDL